VTSPYLVLTGTADAKWWQEKLAELVAERDAVGVERDAAEQRARAIERTLAEVVARLEERDEQLNQAHAANVELNGVIVELDAVIKSMQSTRIWRLGSWYWNLRDRLLRRR
jgi:hypothetical protein